MTTPRGKITYRLRVRTPLDDGDLFVATSQRLNNPGGNQEYNYISEPPKVDGLQVDPVHGDVTVGMCSVRVIDQFASIVMGAGGQAVPPPPPAPGNLIIGNAILAGTWILDYASATLTGTYPPPTGFSFDGWPAAPSGQAELWNVYQGIISGSGHFLRRGTFGVADGLAPSTSYVVRALEASFNDFQPRGVRVPTPFGSGSFSTNDSPGPPPLPKAWFDIPATTDGTGALEIEVGWGTTIPSDANVIYLGSLMVFDTTGTPAGGGQPGGSGGSSAAGTGRLVTSYLADLDARQRLLGLKAVMEESLDGGSTYRILFAGYVATVQQATPMTYEIHIGDTRRVDLVTMFVKASGAAATVILGTMGQASSDVAPNNPTFKVVAVDPTVGVIMLAYDSGPLISGTGVGGPNQLAIGADGKALIARSDAFWTALDQACLSVAVDPSSGFDFKGGIPFRAAFGWNIATTVLMDGLSVDILDGSGNYQRTATPVGYLTSALTAVPLGLPGDVELEPFQAIATSWAGVPIPQGAIVIPWGGTQPSVGTTFKLRVYSVNAAKQFTLQGHPIDLLTQWWRNVGIAYDAAAALQVRNISLGPLLNLSLRFDQNSVSTTTLYDATTQWITSVFGVSWYLNENQERVLFISRDLALLGVPVPDVTITTDDLRGFSVSAFQLDERAIHNRFVVTWQLIRPWDAKTDGGTRPLDGNVSITQQPIQVDFSTNGGISLGGTPEPDSDIAGIKEFRVDIPGFVGQVLPGVIPITIVPADMVAWASRTALGMFTRVGRGVPLVNLDVHRLLADGHDASLLHAGQLVICSAQQLVDSRVGRFPTSQRIKEAGGSRVLQIVQATYTPDGPRLLCWDVGPARATATQPTFTLAADATDPYHVGIATLTNPATIAALATGAMVAVRLGTGTSAPTDAGAGIVGLIDPTVAPYTLTLPQQPGGSRIWVQMATVLPGEQPSAWTAWASLDLTALPPPTGLTATPQANGTDILLQWTPGNTTFPEAVYQDGVLIAVLPPGASQYLVQGVSGSHTYTVRTIDPSPLNGTSTAASVTGTPSGGGTLTAPIDPAGFAGRHDASGLLILDGTFGLEVTATAIPSTVQFEVAVETAVGSGTYGAYAIGAQLSAVQGGRTRFTTSAAQNDGLRRSLRAKSTRNGATDSAYTAAVVVDPWVKQTLPPAPPRLMAVWGAGTLNVFLQGDPTTVSFKVAASKTGYPTATDVRAATALNATNNQATSGTLESGLAVSDLVYVSAFAYTELNGGGTESALTQVTFIYGGGAAPVDAEFVLVAPDTRLPNSRALRGVSPIVLVDNGAGDTLDVTLDTSGTTGIGGSFIGAVSYREPLLWGWQDYVTVPAFPAAVTDVSDIPGLTQLLHSKKDLSALTKGDLRLQAWVRNALSGAKLAYQYNKGGSWYFYDGTTGTSTSGKPFVSLASTGLAVGNYAALAADAFADRETRVVVFGGDGATPVTIGMALLEWALAAANVAPSPGGGAGGSYGDCTVVASDDMEYADITAFLSNGWTLHDSTGGAAAWTIDTAHVFTGSKALKVAVTNGNGLSYMQKTFGTADGLLANTTYTFVLQIYVTNRPAFDVDYYLRAGSYAISGGVSVTGTWVQQKVSATTDSSGNIVVKIQRGPGYPVNVTTQAWYDGLQILNGASC